jgi:hypothetical protein
MANQLIENIAIFGFPHALIGLGKHHGHVRETMPCHGIHGVFYFDWRNLDVVG